jgi:hypothetical protein
VLYSKILFELSFFLLFMYKFSGLCFCTQLPMSCNLFTQLILHILIALSCSYLNFAAAVYILKFMYNSMLLFEVFAAAVHFNFCTTQLLLFSCVHSVISMPNFHAFSQSNIATAVKFVSVPLQRYTKYYSGFS